MTSAAPLIPPAAGLDELRAIASTCTACDLYANATQTVFGVGPPAAPLMLVGEQPGDQEDRRGRPFVGPAGARGTFVEWEREPLILATVHPSSILRAGDDGARRSERAAFVSDLRLAAGGLN